MWYVYILFCDQKIYYVGITDNIQRRVKQHKNGESFYTKKFSEIRLVYFENHNSRKSAEKRELQLKKWTVAKKEALIKGDIELLKKLSKGTGVVDDSGR